MNIALIQLWENFEDNSHQSDGCSLHVDLQHRDNFIKNHIDSELPVGFPSEVSLSDSIWNILQNQCSIRLSEIEMNNLIGLTDITSI